MNSLLAFLLRNGVGLLRDGAEVLIGQALIRAVTQKLKGLIIFYAVLAVFAMAALVFLYVLLYRFVAQRLDDVSAAAIWKKTGWRITPSAANARPTSARPPRGTTMAAAAGSGPGATNNCMPP